MGIKAEGGVDVKICGRHSSGPYHTNSATRPQAEAPGSHTAHNDKQATDLLGKNGCLIKGLVSHELVCSHRPQVARQATTGRGDGCH